MTRTVVVVGVGMAGLAAAGLLAQRGVAVTVLEGASQVGGRAQTQERDGGRLNLEPHALYKTGAARRVLSQLAVAAPGASPPGHAWALRPGEPLSRLPIDPRGVLCGDLWWPSPMVAGVFHAVRMPIRGPLAVARLLIGLAAKNPDADYTSAWLGAPAVQVSVPPKPGFECPGETLTFFQRPAAIYVHLTGSTSLSNVEVQWSLSSDGICDDADDVIIRTKMIETLGVNTAYGARPNPWTVLVDTPPGSYFLCATVDPNNPTDDFAETTPSQRRCSATPGSSRRRGVSSG